MQPFLDGARFSVALAANAGISAASLEWLCRGCLLIYPQHGFRSLSISFSSLTTADGSQSNTAKTLFRNFCSPSVFVAFTSVQFLLVVPLLLYRGFTLLFLPFVCILLRFRVEFTSALLFRTCLFCRLVACLSG